MKHHLNLLIVTRAVPEHGLGGMERHCRDLAIGLTRKGHQITLLTTSHPNGDIECDNNGYTTIFLPDTIPAKYSSVYHSKVIEYLYQNESLYDCIISEGGGLSQYLIQTQSKRNKPVLVIAHGTTGMEMESALSSVPNWKRHIARLRWRKHFENQFDESKEYLTQADKIAAVSSYVAKQISSENNIPFDNIGVIQNGVNIDEFSRSETAREEIRNQWNIPQNALVSLCIGRFAPDKGFHIAIQAFNKTLKNNPSAYLFLVGDGPERNNLEQQIEKYRLSKHILLTGAIASADTVKYYSASDILLIPSLRFEGHPYTLVEGSVSGLAILTTDRGGQGCDIIDGRNGLLAKPGSADDLAYKLNKMLISSDLRNNLTHEMNLYAEKHYDVNCMIDKYDDLISQLK